MSGKPAARLGDPTSHGIPLVPGPPAATVWIGGRPAWKGVPIAAGPALQASQQASEAVVQVAETAALAAEAAAAAGAGTPAGPGLAATAVSLRAEAEATKAGALASMGASITAAAAGGSSLHLCTIPWPIPPHGPGVVIDGSATVMIENMPAARMGDTCVEAIGPPDKVAAGEPTVLIGD